MLNIGVIGYGYWGPNLVRNFAEASAAEVTMVADSNFKRLEIIKKRYPTVETVTLPYELIKSPSVDTIVIATPVVTHFDLALKALQAGKHVLLEKPMEQAHQFGRLSQSTHKR